jgi:hypothetical protein
MESPEDTEKSERKTELLLEREKILKELFAGDSKDRFRMELDPLDFVAAVAHAHNDAVVGFGGDD